MVGLLTWRERGDEVEFFFVTFSKFREESACMFCKEYRANACFAEY